MLKINTPCRVRHGRRQGILGGALGVGQSVLGSHQMVRTGSIAVRPSATATAAPASSASRMASAPKRAAVRQRSILRSRVTMVSLDTSKVDSSNGPRGNRQCS